MASKNFHRVQRLSTLANDTLHMLSDRQTVGDSDAEHGDRCYAGDTCHYLAALVDYNLERCVFSQ